MGLQGLDPNALSRPVAHAYLRLTHEATPHGQITRAFKLLETALAQAVWTAVSLLVESASAVESPEITTVLHALHRPSLGHWAAALTALERALAKEPGWWMDLGRKVPPPEPGASVTVPLREAINCLVALRNRATHQTLGLAGAARLVGPVLDALGEVLDGLGATRLPPPVAVELCEPVLAQHSRRRGAGSATRFTAQVTPLGGTGMQVPAVVDSAIPLVRDNVYQNIPGVGLILLHPFVQYDPDSGRYLLLCGFDGGHLSLLDPLSGEKHAAELAEHERADLSLVFGGSAAEPSPDGPPSLPPSSTSPGPRGLRPLADVDESYAVAVWPDSLRPEPEQTRRSVPGLLADRYRVLESLGAGSSGTVYRATHEGTGQVSAVKLLNREGDADPRSRAQFEREARILAKLEHPGIVQLRDFGDERGRLFLVMEFCSGGSVADRTATGPVPATEALPWLVTVAAALTYAHAEGVVHRDLKPANLMFSSRGEIKIADFGLAHLRETDLQSTAGFAVGTPHYMAPEQIMGQQVDARTDVYALGAILFELLAGHPPYTGGSAFAVQQQHLKAPPPSLRCEIPGTPMALEHVVARAMAKHPEARFPDTASFSAALARSTGWAPGSSRGPAPGDSGPSSSFRAPRESAHSSYISAAGSSRAWPSVAGPSSEGGVQCPGFTFYRNQAVSFGRLTELHYRATSHIKVTRFSNRAIQDRSRYWQAVVDRAHDPEISYYRLTSIRSKRALDSVCAMVDEMTTSSNFHLALTREEHPFEIILRDGEEAVFCFHKGDFVVYAGLAFDGEEDPHSQRIVGLYEQMYDEMWDKAEMTIAFRHEVQSDPAHAEKVKSRIRARFSEYDLP